MRIVRAVLDRIAILPRGRERVQLAVVCALAVFCVIAVAYRFLFAFEPSDEGFSLALAYRFVLGDKPFVDEISIQQTAGIVIYPLVWLYVKLTGGSTGLVIFGRCVHLFIFKGLTAYSVWRVGRRWLRSKTTPIAVATLAFAFVPHSIPSPGYNALGMTFLATGTFLTAAAVAEGEHRRRQALFFWGGLAQGLATFAYPPMGVAPLLAVPLVLLLSRERRWVGTAAFIAGGLASVVLVSPSLAFGGIAGVRRSMGWGIHASLPYGSVRLLKTWDSFRDGIPDFYLYAVIALVVAALVRSRSLRAVVVFLTSIAVAFWFRGQMGTFNGALNIMIYTGTLAPAVLLVARPAGFVWRGALLIAIPSAAAGAAAGFISTQAISAASLGLYASSLLFVLLAARALEEAGGDETLSALPSLMLTLVLVWCSYDYVYREGALATLTETVPSGPFKGIRTTRDRVRMSNELVEITRKYDDKRGRILFLYQFPGFYLFSKMRPSGHTVWQEFYGDQQGMLDYWQKHRNGHGIVVRIKETQGGPVDPQIVAPERLLEETPHFLVYRDQ